MLRLGMHIHFQTHTDKAYQVARSRPPTASASSPEYSLEVPMIIHSKRISLNSHDCSLQAYMIMTSNCIS